MQQIEGVMTDCMKVKYNLVYRECNDVANILARSALSWNWNGWMLQNPPDECVTQPASEVAHGLMY